MIEAIIFSILQTSTLQLIETMEKTNRPIIFKINWALLFWNQGNEGGIHIATAPLIDETRGLPA